MKVSDDIKENEVTFRLEHITGINKTSYGRYFVNVLIEPDAPCDTDKYVREVKAFYVFTTEQDLLKMAFEGKDIVAKRKIKSHWIDTSSSLSKNDVKAWLLDSCEDKELEYFRDMIGAELDARMQRDEEDKE